MGWNWLDRKLADARVEQALSLAGAGGWSPDGSDVLELGCGNLSFLRKLAPSVNSAIGVDIAGPTVIEGNLRAFGMDFDGRRLPFPDESKGAVFMLAVLEHLTKPNETIAEAYRVLKPGGVFVFTTPEPKAHLFLSAGAFFRVISHEQIDDHKQYYTAGGLRLMLAAFDKKKVSPFQFGLNLCGYAVKL